MKYQLALIGICLLISILFFAGNTLNTTFDDATYYHLAEAMQNKTFNIQSTPYAYGIVFIASIAWSLPYFWLPQLIEYMALIIVCYYLCTTYFNERISFLASACLAISPFIFVYATRVLPDMALGLVFAIALLLIARSKEKDIVSYMLAGFLTGSSIAIKFGGLAFIVVMLLGLWLIKGKWKTAHFILGVSAMLLLYQLLLPTGNILSMMQTYSTFQTNLSQATLITNLSTIYYDVLGYNVANGIYNQIYPMGLLFLIVIASAAILIFKGRKNILSLYGFIFLLSYFWLLFGTESFISWHFIALVNRYFILLAAPMAVCVAYAFNWITTKTGNTKLGKYYIYILIYLILLSNLPVYLYFHTYPNLILNFK